MAFFSYYAPPGWCRDLPNFRDPDSAVLVVPNNSERSLNTIESSCEVPVVAKSASDFVAGYLSKYDYRRHSKAVSQISDEREADVRTKRSWFLPSKFVALKEDNCKSAKKLKLNNTTETEESEENNIKKSEENKYKKFGEVIDKSSDYCRLRTAVYNKPQEVTDFVEQLLCDEKSEFTENIKSLTLSIDNICKASLEPKQKPLSGSKITANVNANKVTLGSKIKQIQSGEKKYPATLEDKYKAFLEHSYKSTDNNNGKLSSIKTPLANSKVVNILKVNSKPTPKTSDFKQKQFSNKGKVLNTEEKSSGIIGSGKFVEVDVKNESLPNNLKRYLPSVVKKDTSKFAKRLIKSNRPKPFVRLKISEPNNQTKSKKDKSCNTKTIKSKQKQSNDVSKTLSVTSTKTELSAKGLKRPKVKINVDNTLPIEEKVNNNSSAKILKKKALSSFVLRPLDIKINELNAIDFKTISRKITNMKNLEQKESKSKASMNKFNSLHSEVDTRAKSKKLIDVLKEPTNCNLDPKVVQRLRFKASLIKIGKKQGKSKTSNLNLLNSKPSGRIALEINKANATGHLNKTVRSNKENRNMDDLIFINKKLTRFLPIETSPTLSFTNIKKCKPFKENHKVNDTARKKKQTLTYGKKTGKEKPIRELFSNKEKECTELTDEGSTTISTNNNNKSLCNWPVDPMAEIIRFFKNMPKNCIIADFGSDKGKLSQQLPFLQVHTLGRSSKSNSLCSDLSNKPLRKSSVHVAIFCMSLIGGRVKEYLWEANRVLKIGGLLKIVELSKRIPKIKQFVSTLEKYGFSIMLKNNLDIYRFLDFKKVKDITRDTYLPP